MTPEESRGVGPGMPGFLYLEIFGSVVWDVFGTPPYLVGSAANSKQWRDVDVRLILDDADYDDLISPSPGCPEHSNGKWAGLCMAFSALGKEMTGLPVDFQIQRCTQANERFPGVRKALGLCGHRFLRAPEPPD